MGHWRIDQQGPGADEDQPGAEPSAVGDRPGDEGAGDDAEQALEDRKKDRGDGAHDVSLVGEQLAETGILQRVAEQPPTDVVPEGERVAHERPEDEDDRQRAEGHHHHVEDALGANHPAVEQGQTRCHEQHEGAGDQQPGGVAGVDLGDECGEGGQRAHGGPPCGQGRVGRAHGSALQGCRSVPSAPGPPGPNVVRLDGPRPGECATECDRRGDHPVQRTPSGPRLARAACLALRIPEQPVDDLRRQRRQRRGIPAPYAAMRQR